ncbi:hypothetical protein ACTHPH_21810 [Paenibacillus pasadenensis]|uniref:hypothetical protein n=1 Tax=Paenibacillus pasadenensis TaxID=217090 RepID=UPI00048FD6A2|nr:hypothetical protein [Paenibacillus pasadenensis]
MTLFLYVVLCAVASIAFLVLPMIRAAFLPAARRMRRELREPTRNEFEVAGIDGFVQRILPAGWYGRLESYLIRNGQSYDWSPGKAIRNLAVSTLIGLAFSFFMVLSYFTFPERHVSFILIAILMLPVFPLLPILNFRMGRQDFVTRIIYQTPEFLDILETDLVHGTGNVETALTRARRELDGALQGVIEKAYLHLQHVPGDYPGAGEIIRKHIQVPLYDQMTHILSQYQLTGRAKRNIETLQRSCRVEIAGVIKKQTQKKNLLLTIVTMGLLVNLILLIGVPILFYMLDVQLDFVTAG